MRPLHLLLVCPDARDGRQVQHIGTHTLALLQAGFRVSLLLGEVTSSPLSQLKGVQVYFVPPRAWWKPWQASLAKVFEQTVMADTSIDIVHLMPLKGPCWHVPLIAKRLRIPCVAQTDGSGVFMPKNWPFNKKKVLRVLQACSPLVVHTQEQLDQAKSLGLSSVTLIHQGVDTETFKPVLSKRPLRRKLNLPELGTLVCCMASIQPSNKQLEALEACLPLGERLQLVLVGQVADPAYMAKVHARAAEAGVSSLVHWVDAAASPADYLRASDVFILLGGIEERHDTILEAQSCGLPVVLGTSESTLTLVNGGRNGLVYQADPASQRQLRKLLTNPSTRQTRGMNARPFAKKFFDFEKMMAAYFTLYRSL